MKQVAVRATKFSLCILLALTSANVYVFAQPTTESGNYSLEEVFVGPGGTRESSSGSYSVQGSLGDIGVGESASGLYNFLAGYTTDAEPSLSFAINTSNVDMGVISATTTGTGTASFSVATYNATGYVVQSIGQPPTNNDEIIDPLTSPTASTPGTKQFGINLVANTDPATFGANLAQIPDSTFSFGLLDADYNTTNLYKYVDGDRVAYSAQSTGQTDYTISYMMNVSRITGGGEFSMGHSLVATSTF